MSELLRLSLLGGLHIEREGVAVTGFVSSKAPALLAYLAVTGRPHLRPALAGLLWGEWPEAEALANLRKVLSNLRRTVGPWLSVTPHAVAFDRAAPYWLDVEAFQQHLAAGDPPSGVPQLPSAIGHSPSAIGHPPSAISDLQSAVDLYHGDFLAGFYVRVAPEFEEWVAAQRERLRQMALRAVEGLLRLRLREGALGEALECTERLLALAPWSEEAHRQRMWLLARSGQRSAALAQYGVCRRALERELGVEPSRDTVDLYGRIKAAGTPRPNNLPAQTTPFVGREEERATLLWLLLDGCRLVTLVGPGGVGKTRLALEVAGQAAAEGTGTYADGVYVVPLMGLETCEGLVPSIAQAIGFSIAGRREPRQQLAEFLRRKAMLLVLDNFEQVVEGAGAVADLLRAAPGVTVLATSRARLGLQGEQVVPLSGLRVPEEWVVAAPEVTGYDAVRLFDVAARRAWPRFEVEPQAADVARVCRLVEGMPLAILLVAAWAGALPAAEMAAEVERGLGILAGGGVDLPERQRSQREVFEASWRLLCERERAVFQALSVFRGGFCREAAGVVAGATLGELRSLVDKSFVHCPSEGWYAVHELLRQYAAEKLDEGPEADELAHDRHCAYYCTRLEQWEADLRGPKQQAALAEMDRELQNACAAWDWAVGRSQAERLHQAAGSFGLFCYWRVRLREGEDACRRAAESLSAAPCRGWLRSEARMLSWQGVFAWQLGHAEVSRSLLMRAWAVLDQAEAAGEDARAERAFLLQRLASLVEDADHDQARRFYEQSLELYRETDNPPGIATALHGLGWIAWYAGAHSTARQLREESLAIRRAVGDPRAIAASLSSMVRGSLYEGRFDEAERLARECIAIRQALGDRHNLAWSLVDSAALCLWSGRFEDAASLYQQGVAIWSDLGADTAIFDVTIAAAELLRGSYEQAVHWARRGLAGAAESGNLRATGLGRLVLGGVALVRESFVDALCLLQESVNTLSGLGQRTEQGWALGAQAYAARRLGQPTQAQGHVQMALRAACEAGDSPTILFALPAQALLCLDQGQAERAAELYALASGEPFVGNSRWFEDVAGRAIAAAAASLEPSVAAGARERGRARSLKATVAELLAELGG